MCSRPTWILALNFSREAFQGAASYGGDVVQDRIGERGVDQGYGVWSLTLLGFCPSSGTEPLFLHV